MHTLRITEDTRMDNFEACIKDMHSRVLPAIQSYVQSLLQRYPLDAVNPNAWTVDSAGVCISPYPGPLLDVYYDLKWDGEVTTIEPLVIAVLIRHVLRRKTQLIETFNVSIETPWFHDGRTGATGRLVVTRK